MSRAYARMLCLVWLCARLTRPSNRRFSQTSHLFTFWCYLRGPDGMEKEKKLDSRCIVSLGFRLCSRGRQRTGILRGCVPSRRGTRRGRHAIFTALSLTGDLSSRTARTRVSHSNQPCLQKNLLCRASRLALFARNCSHGMCDPPHSRTRRQSLVQPVRTSQLRGAAPRRVGPSISVLIGLGCQLAARSCALVWVAQAGQTAPAQGKRTVSTTQNQTSKWNLDVAEKLLPSCTQTGTSASGTILAAALSSESLSSLIPHSDPRRSIRGSPLTKSDRLSHEGGRAYRV